MKNIRRTIEVWYAKNPVFRCNLNFVDASDLAKTHTRLQKLDNIIIPSDYTDIDICQEIFIDMQGENWSPNGEANELIESLGLYHTSMSVGDVIVIDGIGYMCDSFGWKKLNETLV